MANSMYLTNFTLQQTGSQAATATFGQIKACAVKVVDGESRTKMLTRAGEYIKSCVLIQEMDHLFRFARDQSTDTTLVDGTATYSVPSDYYAMSEVQLVDATTANPFRKLREINWNDLQMLEPSQERSSVPVYWTALNDWADQAVELYPVPNAGAASKYKLRITYYKRLTEPVADSDTIAAPKGFGEVLCAYGQYRLVQNQDPDNVALWRDFKSEYLRLSDKFKHSVTRSKANVRQSRVASSRNMGTYNRSATDFDPLA